MVNERFAGFSVWLCLVLISAFLSPHHVQHKCALCQAQSNAGRAVCLPPRSEQPYLSCHEKQVLEPLQQEGMLPFLVQSPPFIEFRVLRGDADQDLLCRTPCATE